MMMMMKVSPSLKLALLVLEDQFSSSWQPKSLVIWVKSFLELQELAYNFFIIYITFSILKKF